MMPQSWDQCGGVKWCRGWENMSGCWGWEGWALIFHSISNAFLTQAEGSSFSRRRCQGCRVREGRPDRSAAGV